VGSSLHHFNARNDLVYFVTASAATLTDEICRRVFNYLAYILINELRF
jgi:hypothetical protein